MCSQSISRLKGTSFTLRNMKKRFFVCISSVRVHSLDSHVPWWSKWPWRRRLPPSSLQQQPEKAQNLHHCWTETASWLHITRCSTAHTVALMLVFFLFPEKPSACTHSNRVPCKVHHALAETPGNPRHHGQERTSTAPRQFLMRMENGSLTFWIPCREKQGQWWRACVNSGITLNFVWRKR